MNNNGKEVEFCKRGDEFDMWVERDCAPFDTYICGILKRDWEGYVRFHPTNNVVMHQKLLRDTALKVNQLNSERFS